MIRFSPFLVSNPDMPINGHDTYAQTTLNTPKLLCQDTLLLLLSRCSFDIDTIVWRYEGTQNCPGYYVVIVHALL